MVCTKLTKRCKYDRYDKKLVSPKCCHRNLKAILLFFIELANQFNIQYFLDFGTLLGCIRNGKIIPHDTDIDVSVLESDCKKLERFKPFFRKKGFVFECQNNDRTFYRIFYSKINRLHVDIYIRKLNDDGIYCCGLSVENWGIHKDSLFPMQEKLFEGKLMKIPKGYKKYLEIGYGKDCIKNPKRKDEYERKP